MPLALRRPAAAGDPEEPQVIPPTEQAVELPPPLPPARAPAHREACRQRIEGHLREANGPRIIAADARWATRVVAQGDPSLEPRAEEGEEWPPAGEPGGTELRAG